MRFIGFVALMIFPIALCAEEADKPLGINLISEVRSISSGKPFFLGFHLKHPQGSHTYWKFPGIVGIATQIEWGLPAGFTAGEIQWPAPQVVKMAGHDAQGYEGETLLMISITPPKEIAGTSVEISAKASWMCCAKTCHPATKIPFSIRLPVRDAAEIDSSNVKLFQRYRKQLPSPASGWRTIAAKRDGAKIILTLEPAFREPDPFMNPGEIRFFTSDGQVNSERIQQVKVSPEGVIVMTLDASEMAPKQAVSLPGVVVISTGKSPQLIEINPRY